MKTIVLTSLSALLILVAQATAENLKTLDGTEYEDVTITGNDDAGLNILHKNGGAFIHFQQLPPEYRKRYDYDPGKIWFENHEWARSVSSLSSRPVFMVFLEPDTSKASQALWEDVLTSRKFNRYAHKKIIRLAVNFPATTPIAKAIREQNEKLKEEYEIEDMPIAVLLDPDGEYIAEVVLKDASSSEDVSAAIDEKLAEHQAKIDAAKAKAEAAKQKAMEEAAAQDKSGSTPAPSDTASQPQDAPAPAPSSTASTNSGN